MGCLLFRNLLITGLLLAGYYCPGLSRPPTRQQLEQALLGLSAHADPGSQAGALQNWQQQWQRGGYAPDSTYINGLLQTGVAYLYQNELAKATQVTRQAVQLMQARRADIAPDQPAKALYRLGMLLTSQNQPATNTLKQALRHGQGIPSANRWVGASYLYLSYAYYLAGDFQQALSSARCGEQVARNTSDRALLAKLLQEKANALLTLQQYEPAHQAARQAVGLAQQNGYKEMAVRGYCQLGIIAKNRHQLPNALYYCQRAFQEAPASDQTRPNYAVEVGMIYSQLRQYEKAVPYFRYGLDHNTNAYHKSYALGRLGHTYGQRKSFSTALTHYQRGLMMMPIGFRDSAVTSLPNARSILQADHKESLLILIQDKADTWLDWAKATNNNRHHLQRALETYRLADQMIDYMRWGHTGQQSKLYWRQNTRSMYERAIETCYRLADAEQAFRFFEKSRAVMLADKLNELGARQQLTAKQVAREKMLRQAVDEGQAELAVAKPNSPANASAQLELVTRQDNLDAFRKQLETTNPAYYRYKYDTTITSVANLQQHLKKLPASFVTYFEGDSALYLLAVTAGKATLQRQPVGAYTQTIRQFMPLLANPEAMNRTATVARFLALGNRLYRQLLAPLSVPAGRVIVSPDGSFIPFETLSQSATQPHYLVNTYAFSYAYSAHLLLRHPPAPAQTTVFGTGDFLGIAPVAFAPRLGQATLAGSDLALKPIASHFGSPTLLTHQAATRRAFQTQVSAYRVVHLFTHATADSIGQEPTLYFADSTLRLSDFGDGALPNTQLVVLAACKTGIGAHQRGEGVFSLARGFSALGTPSVLTTLWSVENDATYRLTDGFYRYLDQGLAKDVALQRAKQDWLATAEGASQLPNYWAGLILIGDPAPLRKNPRWPWLAGGSLLVLGAGGMMLHRHRKRRVSPATSWFRPA